MSAYLKKYELVEWLKERSTSDWWYNETNELSASFDYAHGVSTVLWAIERGEFDWHGESE